MSRSRWSSLGLAFSAAATAGCGSSAPASAAMDVDASSVDQRSPSDAGGDGGARDATGSPLPLPSPLVGVTVDDVSHVDAVVTALSGMPHRPTTRVVFDVGQPPSAYTSAVRAISGVSYVLGEILDSSAVAKVSVAAYAQRTADYLEAFPTNVDLWEVGNEINGNWLGKESDVAEKMTRAFDAVKRAGGKTELTLYGCSDSGDAYDMFVWTKANVPARMLTGLDYVLVSYYEGDCGVPRTDWPSAMKELADLFPHAGVGFGEVGYVDENGNDLAREDEPGAARYLDKYYGMKISLPRYVGGHFWWYFAEDMVPDTRPLFAALSDATR